MASGCAYAPYGTFGRGVLVHRNTRRSANATVEDRVMFPCVQTSAIATSPTFQGYGSTLSRINRNRFVWRGGVLLLVALYLAFTIHDSVINLYEDDWLVVRLINGALHHHLTLGEFWSDKGTAGNRLFFPFLIVTGVGLATNDNTRVMVVVNAVAFSASYLIVLLLLRSYLRRALTLVSVLTTGLIWFSLLDYLNALWGVQFAWYLIVLCFVAMLYFLLRDNRGVPALVCAMVLAVIASYSSIQGLLLWIVGLFCLLWPFWHARGESTRRQSVELITWLVVGTTTAAIFFWNSAPIGLEPPSWALSHPGRLVQFFVVEVGNVIPQTGLVLHELIGTALCVVSLFVVVQSFLLQRNSQRLPLPIALISFGLLWDAACATGRLSLGLAFASLDVYTMPTLLVVVGIVCYGLWWFSNLERTTAEIRARRRNQIALAALTVLLLVQVATSTEYGFRSGNQLRQQFSAGARTTVILGRTPYSQWTKYEIYGTVPNVYLATYLRTLIPEAKADHLGPFNNLPTAPRPRPVVQPPPTAQPPSTQPPASHVYVVQPGDTLWALAARYLGNPLRYQELFALNKGISQIDGFTLVDPNLIYPGMKLLFPADATGIPPPAP